MDFTDFTLVYDFFVLIYNSQIVNTINHQNFFTILDFVILDAFIVYFFLLVDFIEINPNFYPGFLLLIDFFLLFDFMHS